MRNRIRLAMWVGALALPLAACNEPSTPAVAEQTFGPSPTLPAPQHSWIPTIDIAAATGWPAGGKPTAANGMAVNAFATGLDHPRTVYVLPNGDVLASPTPKPDDGKGIKAWATHLYGPRRANTPSANRITLLRDADGDGVAETKRLYRGAASPFGMALVARFLRRRFDAIEFPYHDGDTVCARREARGPARQHINHHWTKDHRQSGWIKTTQQSAPTAMSAKTAWRPRPTAPPCSKSIAPALNGACSLPACQSNGPSWQPQGGALWVTVNERDELGNDLVRIMTSVQDGGFYGWPFGYGQHVDDRVN